MRGVYTATYKISGVTAGKTLLYLTAPANKVVEILGAEVGNCSNETNEQFEVTLQRIGTLGTPTATTITPTPAEAGDAAAGSTVKGNVTASEPTYSSAVEYGRQGAPSLGGWFYKPQPEERPTVGGGASIGLLLLTTITSADLIATLTFREIG